MNERRACPHVHQQKLEGELKRKTESRDETVAFNAPASSPRLTTEQPAVRHLLSRPTAVANANWNLLTKDREIAKLKALLFQKDDELIELTTVQKNALRQMEERMERERKLWNEHKELLLAGERAKLEEEKTRLHKDLHDQLKLEQERCQRLEQKLYTAQTQASEAQLTLKESGRERINAVYAIKEQCRKEFLEEIARLRNQFQLEKDKEVNRLQERIRDLEGTLLQLSNDNAALSSRTQSMMVTLDISEKACVRSLNDCVKRLLMATDSPSSTYTSIPTLASLTYDQQSLIERLPTRSVLKLLQDKIDDVRKYIAEQKVQLEVKSKSKTLTDRSSDYSNRVIDDSQNSNSQTCEQWSVNAWCKPQKENDYDSFGVKSLSPTENNYLHTPTKSAHPFQLTSRQNDTIDNLVQKFENQIAFELDRLTKQRLTSTGLYDHDDTSMLFHSKQPNKLKDDMDATDKLHHDVHSRPSRGHRQLKVSFASQLENPKPPVHSPMHLHKNSTIE